MAGFYLNPPANATAGFVATVAAFNALGAGEQAEFAQQLADALEAANARDGITPAGPPLPPFLGLMAEARSWAALAGEAELRAYAAAIWERMDAAARGAFLAWASRDGRAAA